MRDRIKKVLADTFKTDIGAISDHAGIDDFADWDSLNHFKLIMNLEEEFAINFATDIITELTSIEKIMDAITSCK